MNFYLNSIPIVLLNLRAKKRKRNHKWEEYTTSLTRQTHKSSIGQKCTNKFKTKSNQLKNFARDDNR